MEISSLKLFSLIFAGLILVNCLSIKNYFRNRLYDATDMVTIGLEKNVFGFAGWISCFGGGLQYAHKGIGFGLRNGNFGFYKTGGDKLAYINSGNSILLLNSYAYIAYGSKKNRANKKVYRTRNILGIIPVFPVPVKELQDRLTKDCKAPVALELSAGIYFGIRVGINFSEILDFVLGWTTIDIMDDDEIEGINQESNLEPLQEMGGGKKLE